MSKLLGIPVASRDSLPGRGADVARFRVGETWIVLVQPVNDGAPARHLARHGEGSFLISFEVEDFDTAVRSLRHRGTVTRDAVPRSGLDGWRVIDIETDPVSGIVTQLCEDRSARGE